MSLARFSPDSDLYVYQQNDGRFLVMIAAVRYPPLTDEQFDAMGRDGYIRWLHTEATPIDGERDGESFETNTAAGLVSELQVLEKLGYRVPASLYEQLSALAGA